MKLKIALAGNPNCGKTTLFNALTGSNQFVGNWPGVTVEKKEGELLGYDGVTVTDLPGIYSLSPYTLEEVVARNYLLYECPDVILNIIDGTNPERNLYLTTQLTELGIPVVIAVNMMDAVRSRGDKIDTAELARRLGCAVVEISAIKGEGIHEAAQCAVEAAKSRAVPQRLVYTPSAERAICGIEGLISGIVPEHRRRWYALKLFERDEEVTKQAVFDNNTKSEAERITADIEARLDDDSESIITNERYNSIALLLKGCYKKKRSGGLSVSDRIDRIVTNRFLALPVFAAVMVIIYYISVSTVGALATDWMNEGVFGDGWNLFSVHIPGIPVIVRNALSILLTPDWLNSLILDGIVGGVGAVLGFVPQMIMLFFFLTFLEACGYMARIAFIMDRIFCKFGLSGKSFIPMLIGTGCGVPGIMASRTIENERDRRMTIITTTFIPCGAKLPVIALIASSMFGGAWWVAPSAYFAGIAAIVISGIMLKKTRMFSGNPAPFVMELPDYHMPTAGNIARYVRDRTLSFIKKAGTVILLASVAVWGLSSFQLSGDGISYNAGTGLEKSLLGVSASAVAWIFSPLGFGNIKAAVATIMGLIAKEEIVGVFGVLDLENMTALGAYSFLIFNLLCAPCFAAMGAIRREMNSVRWTWFAIGYQCGLAYVAALIINQFGLMLSGRINIAGFVCAVIALAFIAYMIFRKPEKSKKAGEHHAVAVE